MTPSILGSWRRREIKKTSKTTDEINNNIVRIEFDADFYIDRAIFAANRGQYEKALKYFRIAIEKEPDNTYNYLNLAGLLAELGRFEESNEVLEGLLYDIAPTLFDCLYYLANNFISLGEFELAEEYLFKYIQSEPEGEYKDEAEELLQVVACELGRAPGEICPSQQTSHLLKQEEARFLLEAGEYTKAKQILEEIVHQQLQTPRWGDLQLVYSREDPVLDCFLQQMEGYSKEQRKDAKNLWTEFVTNEPREIVIRKAETWAAAIEYIISTDYGLSVSRRDVADKYDVSTSSVNRNLRRLLGFLEKKKKI